MANPSRRNWILQFVRGDRSWKDLEKAGMFIAIREQELEVDNPWQIVVTVSPKDVAKGLIVYHRTQDELQRWARIVLGGSTFIALSEEFENTREGDLLLGSLWDASQGDDLSGEAIELAERLAGAICSASLT